MKQNRILIVDDHAMIRDGLKNLVHSKAAYVVAGEASNGAEAIELYGSLLPDMVIMDISMPDQNGIDVSRKILDKYPDAKILIFSMYGGEDYIVRCIEIGVRGYVLKNETGQELDNAIQSILSGNTYFSRNAQNVIFNKFTQKVVRQKQPGDELRLTAREIEIVKLIAEGFTSQEMADKLFISPRTVETHRANLMKKAGVHTSIELVKKIQDLRIL